MHDSAMQHGKLFFDTYIPDGHGLTIIEIGSQNVNGSLREVAPASSKYIGLDFVAANGVDVVIDDPYKLPLEDSSIDVCVSSSCFEHSEFFWLSFLEVMRVLKPNGLFYLNAPSNGMFHRYPVDCWRFYPDSGKAMANWSRRNGYKTQLLEAFTGKQMSDGWSDYVAIYLKDEMYLSQHSRRIIDTYIAFTNGMVFGDDKIMNEAVFQEDQLRSKKVISS
jgi:SAM-dependent methyltransferase